ncbi:hypothetical protein [uncultured Ruegeria sp.]|uniref:phage adaptor protein n=1 Tax=uncultured Ruegeria sp. TaxID=259304 RepID=UPI0026276813|nr:hypothetical protein [uncultured Ruegeria sp.]
MTLTTVALSCAKQLGRVNAAGTDITDLEAEIKEQIQETIRFYNRKPYHLTEFRGFTLDTAASTVWYSSVDLTSGDGDQSNTSRTAVDTNQILNITYSRENPGSSGLNEPLDRIPYAKFERLREGSTPQGTPTYYTYYAGQIGIWPTPDGVYELYFSGHVKPVVPTNDSDTSVWFDEANEMIEAGALKRVCLKYLRDKERAADFGIIEDGAARAMAREHLLKSSTGKLKVHD